jgi:hypothetical protein
MMLILCLITDVRYRTTAYGILNFFSTIIGGNGLYAGGALRDANIGLSAVFRSCSVFAGWLCTNTVCDNAKRARADSIPNQSSLKIEIIILINNEL